MKTYNMNIVKENMLMSAELIKVMKILEENNIEALAFKGPTLAQMAYGDITLRQYSDLDILVNSNDLYKTAKLFLSHNLTTDLDIEFLKNTTLLEIGSDFSFYYNNTHIELHWNLFRKLLLQDNNSFNVWNEKKYVKINHHKLRTLPNDYLLIYLCIHGSKHLWERVEWIVDIDKLIRKYNDFNWEFIETSATALNSKNMLLIGLSLSHKLFQTPLPHNILMQLNSKKIQKLTTEFQNLQENNTMHEIEGLPRIFLKFKFITKMQDNIFNAITYYLASLFKPTHYDTYYVKLPKSLSWGYYFTRPIRLLSGLLKNKE